MARVAVAALCLGLVQLAGVAVTPAAGQCDSCTVISREAEGGYLIEIGGQLYAAITPEQQRRYLQQDNDLKLARAELEFGDSLRATYDEAIAQFETTLAAQKVYAAELDSLYRGYKEVAEGYKRLSSEALFSVELGLGLTGSDTEPALMAGLGISRLRIWGFFQEGNSGVLVGVHWRLF
jgi:hypothetical protein